MQAACGGCCTCTAWQAFEWWGLLRQESHGLQQLHACYGCEPRDVEPVWPLKAAMQRRIMCDSQGFSCKQVVPVFGVEASQSDWPCMLTQTTAAAKLMGCSN